MLVSENGYKQWLKKLGYKEFTPSGLPSTIYSYVCAIKKVMKREGIQNWSQLADQIGRLVFDYGEFGKHSEYGKQSNSTVINALERFKDYLRMEFGFVPKRVLRTFQKETIEDTITEIPDIKISTKF